MNNTAILSLYAVIAFAVIVGIIAWTGQQDVKRDRAYQLYEVCVQMEYNTTPEAYYQQHGHAPEC